MTNTKTMFYEHPTIEFPQSLIDLGFEDRSYHNDLAAGAWLKLADRKWLCLWVAQADPAEREYDDQAQYYAWLPPYDEESDSPDISSDMEPSTVYVGESLDELVKVVEGMKETHCICGEPRPCEHIDEENITTDAEYDDAKAALLERYLKEVE